MTYIPKIKNIEGQHWLILDKGFIEKTAPDGLYLGQKSIVLFKIKRW